MFSSAQSIYLRPDIFGLYLIIDLLVEKKDKTI